MATLTHKGVVARNEVVADTACCVALIRVVIVGRAEVVSELVSPYGKFRCLIRALAVVGPGARGEDAAVA